MQTLPLQTRPAHLQIVNARAVDGDAIQAHIVLPLGILCQRRIRLKGFLAPELHGRDPQGAATARDRLQAALNAHECHIQCHGMREDRYGRLAATLLLNGRIADPLLVLGEYQLSAHEHMLDLRSARAGGVSAAS